ncbi:KpsF/GutQ family sugar-phosphate isomerase [Maridesulfovibrio hydrothermalis]|uniref:Arabinose 5-phosphate isomerase KdsD n=1 Tax=Maridesulfovibrio hydrothermalis AM13 = DSM 14728 TaxID=1121451 RepID=L0RAN4_9BACT|nr:KpsF/GutQ family sugar-phosphate isomerase [Maridesulfovibrio hydrothermalis]CCO23250.1 Arabinose 5-phosphate isomerase KdsD [Maridesulfovibrio hydrothermalis AM13 = DSM 14728]
MTEKQLADFIERGREVLKIEENGLAAIRNDLDLSFAKAVEMLAGCKGRVIITGLGKSGLVGRKIAATMSSTGTPSFFLHPVEGAHGDLGMVRAEDVVIAISNSGETDELNSLLPAIRSFGTKIISITSEAQSSMGRLSDIVVKTKVPCEACSHGLAPTSSTTAALAMGDALAVCLMDHKSFDDKDFKKFHPGGSLGRRLTLCISELMHTDNIPAAPQQSRLKDALLILDKGRLGLVALTAESGKLSGVITDGDVRRLVCTGQFDIDRPACEVMAQNPLRITPDMSAAQALDIMEAKEITVLPVVTESGTISGMIHLHDLLGKGRLKFADNQRG